MSLVFARIGVEFERIEAMDGKFLSDQQRDAVTLDDGIHAPLTHTEVACFLSHRKAWTMVAEGDEPYGAVFEDDIILSDNAAPWLLSHDWIPAGTDAVKLETLGDRTWVSSRMIDLGDGYGLAKLCSTHWGTAGYILSRDFARRLLGETERFSITVDGLLFNHEFGILDKIVCYQFLPALCVQARFAERHQVAQTFLADIGRDAPGAILDTTIEQSVRRVVRATRLGKLRQKLLRMADKMVRRLTGQIRRTIPFDANPQQL